jgi:feruloyl esterase
VSWREQGIAPDTLLASLPAGQGVNNTGGVMTRPLCAYPDVARYTGRGSIYDANNFRCKPGPH